MTIEQLPEISYIDENPTIRINTEPENRLHVRIVDEVRNSVLFDGSLWPDFSGNLNIELAPLVSELWDPVEPAPFMALQRNFANLRISFPDEHESDLTTCVNLFSRDGLNRMSDADELTVPADYWLPISYPAADHVNKAFILCRGSSINLMELMIYTDDIEKGMCAALVNIERSGLRPGDVFRVLIDNDTSSECYSPYYRVCGVDMQQYLFYNRLGGWDNIAMSGSRSLVPEYDLVNAMTGTALSQATKRVTRKYQQSSGWMTYKSAVALAELMESPAVFHLCDGYWRRIVIDDAKVAIDNQASIHSISFNYLYSDHKKYVL